MIPILAALLALAPPATAAEPPYFLQGTDSLRDVGGINENSRALSDSIRKTDLTNGGTVDGALVVDAITFADGTSQTTSARNAVVSVASSVVTAAIEAPDSSTLALGVAGSTIAFTCSGTNPIQVNLTTVLSDTNNGQIVKIGLYMDGAVIDAVFTASVGCSEMRETGSSSQGYYPASCHWIRSCSAGAHTFYWSISESGTTGRARCDEAACVMTVQQTQ